MKFMLVDIPNSDSTVVFGFDSYAMFTNKDLNIICLPITGDDGTLFGQGSSEKTVISHEKG